MALPPAALRSKLGGLKRRVLRRLAAARRSSGAAGTPLTPRQKISLGRAAYKDAVAATLRAPNDGDRRELVRARNTLVEELERAPNGPQLLIATARELARQRRWAEAQALSDRASSMHSLKVAAQASRAVPRVARGKFQEAAHALAALSPDEALQLVAPEVVAVAFSTDAAAGAQTCSDVIENRHDLLPEAWLVLARTAYGFLEIDLCDRALGRLRSSTKMVRKYAAVEAKWLGQWVERARRDRSAEPLPQGHVGFAIIDYKQPDYRQVSANIGDYVQTLASLGHLVRHQDLRFHGDPELVKVLGDLQERVRPDRRLSGIERDVSVLTMQRDASSLDTVPPGTWMLAFGWYMHSWFHIRWDFPFHPNLRPLFISFHINHPEAFSRESLDYLREHAPIGCRDWVTVDRLLDLGIPAYFSGCMTTTVNMLFPAEAPHPPANAPVAFVDLVPGKEPHVERPTKMVRHSGIGVRGGKFVPNLRRAVEMLAAYRTDFTSVATSRLHCLLPVRSLGVDVEFLPKNEKDIRFDGLVGLDDAQFAAMQQGIRDKIEAVLSSILRGDDDDTVRKTWWEVCARDLEIAKERHAAKSR